MGFEQLQSYRRQFLEENKNRDHVIIKGQNHIVLSTPHAVSQVRLGRPKQAEIGTLSTALYLQKTHNCYLIAKTKNNFDDANFDAKSRYKDALIRLIEKNDINYVVDLHGLASKRDCDVNLGTHLSENISVDKDAFDTLYNALVKNNFVTTIDQPFMGGNQTIAGSMRLRFPHIWTIQIEVNCAITNKKENFKKYKLLLKILSDWIEYLKSKKG